MNFILCNFPGGSSIEHVIESGAKELGYQTLWLGKLLVEDKRLLRKYLNKGKVIPSKVIVKFLNKKTPASGEGIIVVGFPRTTEQLHLYVDSIKGAFEVKIITPLGATPLHSSDSAKYGFVNEVFADLRGIKSEDFVRIIKP